MKKQNLYTVTVVGSFTKDILVWAEDEDAALDFAQSICDNTDLISFDGREILDVTAEEVEEIDPTGVGEPAEECCENCRGNRAGCGGFSCGRMADDEDDEGDDGGDEDEDDPCLRSLLSAGEEIYKLRQIAGALLLDNLMGRLRK